MSDGNEGLRRANAEALANFYRLVDEYNHGVQHKRDVEQSKDMMAGIDRSPMHYARLYPFR